MKKLVLSILLFLVLLLAAGIFLPYIFKDRIIEAIKTEANDQLNAKVDFNNSIKINIFRSFPDLSIGIRDLVIIPTDSSFMNDTLFYASNSELKLDLMRLYKEQEFLVKQLKLIDAKSSLRVNKDNKANWDIFKDTTESESSSMLFEFDRISVRNADITYLDETLNMSFEGKGLNILATGEYRNDSLIMVHTSNIEDVNFVYDGIPYLSHHAVQDSGDLLLDLMNEVYAFKNNKMLINALPVDASASFTFIEEAIDMDIDVKSSTSNMSGFFSLIPAIYASDYTSMLSEGKGALSFMMKGMYDDNHFPAFDLKFLLENGSFKYPDLSEQAKDIYLDFQLANKDGVLENTMLNIPKFHFKLGSNPIDGKLMVKRLMANPSVDLSCIGMLDLNSIRNIVPLESEIVLRGKLYSDLNFIGQIDQNGNVLPGMDAQGELEATQIYYKDASMEHPLEVAEAKFNFNNDLITIPVVAANWGGDDMHFEGSASNYLAYISDKGTLNADLKWYSKKLNINNYLDEETEEQDTIVQGKLIIPDDIAINATAVVDELTFGSNSYKNIHSSLSIKESVLDLKDLSADLFGGRMELSGFYNTQNESPLASLGLNYANLKISELLKSAKWLNEFVPFAKNLEANTLAKLNFSSALNDNMTPKLNMLDLGGTLSVEQLNMKQLSILQKIDEKLGFKQFSVDKLQDFLLQFDISDGNLRVMPFKFLLDSSFLELEGVSKLDGSIDYKGMLAIPSSYFAKEQNSLNSLLSASKLTSYQYEANDLYKIAVTIGGTFYKPEVKLNLKEIKKNVSSSLKAGINSEADKLKQKAKEEAQNELNTLKDSVNREAEAAKQKMLDEMERKKREAEEKLRKEAEEKKKKLKEEADKKLKDLFKK